MSKLRKSLGDAVLPGIILLIAYMAVLAPEIVGWKDGHQEAHIMYEKNTEIYRANIDEQINKFKTDIKTILILISEVKTELKTIN